MKPGWEADPDPLIALAGGDVAPFESFVRAATGPLLGFFGRLGADAHEAEDLTQQTFVRLYEFAPSYRPEQRFSAFVFRIARNALIDLRRRSGRSSSLDELGAAAGDASRSAALRDQLLQAASGPVPAPGAALETADEAQKLLRGVGELPEGQRAVFELAVVQGLPYADVAASLDVPVGTVKSRMHHAVLRLRAFMQAETVRVQER